MDEHSAPVRCILEARSCRIEAIAIGTPNLARSGDPPLRTTLPTRAPCNTRNISSARTTGTGALEIGTHMSLSERVKTEPRRIHGLECSIGRILDTLKGAELEALLTMLGTPEKRGWSQNDIYEALRAEGFELGRQTINRHRAKGCRCFK